MHERDRQRHRRQCQPLAPHQDFGKDENDRQRCERTTQTPKADQHDNDADGDQDIVKSPHEPRLLAVFGCTRIKRSVLSLRGGIRRRRPEDHAAVRKIGFQISHLVR
ncbi:hypothetical protein D9M68_743810 [compost metagenome]